MCKEIHFNFLAKITFVAVQFKFIIDFLIQTFAEGILFNFEPLEIK